MEFGSGRRAAVDVGDRDHPMLGHPDVVDDDVVGTGGAHAGGVPDVLDRVHRRPATAPTPDTAHRRVPQMAPTSTQSASMTPGRPRPPTGQPESAALRNRRVRSAPAGRGTTPDRRRTLRPGPVRRTAPTSSCATCRSRASRHSTCSHAPSGARSRGSPETPPGCRHTAWAAAAGPDRNPDSRRRWPAAAAAASPPPPRARPVARRNPR